MRPMSKEERREAFVRKAEAMYEELEAWYDGHEGATYGEIEAEVRRQRRELMGEAQAILINGRDAGYQAEAPLCPQCEQPMRLDRYVTRQVSGLEGEVELERAYYRCPRGCGEGFFPPGPEAEATPGRLE